MICIPTTLLIIILAPAVAGAFYYWKREMNTWPRNRDSVGLGLTNTGEVMKTIKWNDKEYKMPFDADYAR